MKKRIALIMTLILVMSLATPLSAQAAGVNWLDGIGSTTNTWDAGGTISSAAELAQFCYNVNNGKNYSGQTILLTQDIDLSGAEWTPVNGFAGTFNGAGNSVNNMSVATSRQYNGFFGNLNTATITSLTVSGEVTSGGTVATGGIVAFSTGGSTITKCHNAVNITNVGSNVGGIIGGTNSTATAVSDSYNTGNISATGNAIGGIGGYRITQVSNCYNIGTVSGWDHVGGIVGQYDWNTLITNVVNLGNVSAHDNVGSIVGLKGGIVSNAVALNQSLTATGGSYGRIANNNACSNTYAWDGMLVNGSTIVSTDATSKNGASVTKEAVNLAENWSVWFSNFDINWVKPAGELPNLKAFSTDSVAVPAYLQVDPNTAIATDQAALDATDFTYGGSDDKDNVTQNITLPLSGANGSTISWAEKIDIGNNVVVSGDAVTVTRLSSAEGDKTVTLTATISKAGGTSATKDIDIVVKAYTVAEETAAAANTAIAADKAALDATDFTYGGSDDKDNVTQNITLPLSGANGSTISWVEKTDIGNNVVVSGDTVTVTRPSNVEGDKTATLTATISKATGTSETKDISLVIKASAPTYSITYDMNGATGGTAPTDGNNYEQGANATILGNTGNLVKSGYSFVGWNTQADGNGTDKVATSTYMMGTSNITFFAKWIANANLSNISVSNGVLSPDFEKNTITYAASVAYNTSTITVTPTLDDLSGSIIVNGSLVISGQSSDPISLVEGENNILIVTTAIDHTTQKTYTLTITREADVDSGASTGNLGGSVTDGTNPLADVFVRVMKGGTNGTQYGDTLITNAQGEFTFSNLPYGTYSLVGTKGDGIITKAIIIQEPATTQNLEIPTGKQKTLLEVGDGTASVAASNLDEMFTVTDAAIILGGGEVILKLVIDQKNPGDVAADAALIQSAIQSGSEVGAYFDINMLRTVTGSGGSDVIDELVQPPAGKSLSITVDVPVALRNKAPYQIIRVHGGVTAVLPATYDSALHTLTFAGDLFSVYSIVYTTPVSSTSSHSTSLTKKIIALVGDTRITPAVTIDTNSDNEIEITLRDTLKDIVADDEKGSDIIVPIKKSAEKITVNLSGDTIETLIDKESNIVIETPNGTAALRASDFNLDSFKDDEGNPITPNEMKVSITITMSGKTDRELDALSNTLGVELIVPLGSVDVTLNNGKMSMKLDQMNDYVIQKIKVPEGIDATKISTAVFIDNKGKMNQTPTQISIIDKEYVAIVYCLYLGTETYFISNSTQLQQVEKHWGENAVNDMASRLVLTNTNDFEPNKAITRADFAEYIVRALGVYREDLNIENQFSDINDSDENVLAILIAYRFGIVTGYRDGTLRPDQQITREEAMVMYQRAMKIMHLVGADTDRYQSYIDYQEVGSWATEYIKEVLSAHVFNGTTATTIAPKASLTYAEAAQAIKNLLVESNLINE